MIKKYTAKFHSCNQCLIYNSDYFLSLYNIAVKQNEYGYLKKERSTQYDVQK